jgi:hypothetical protein
MLCSSDNISTLICEYCRCSINKWFECKLPFALCNDFYIEHVYFFTNLRYFIRLWPLTSRLSASALSVPHGSATVVQSSSRLKDSFMSLF